MNPEPAQTHVAFQWQHDSPLICCRFDPQGRYVFATAEDSTLQRWDLSNGAKVKVGSHESWINSVAFSADGQSLISAGCDGRIRWWSAGADHQMPARSIDAHLGWVRYVAVSPDGKVLASAGNDRAVRLWNVADGSFIRELLGHDSHVYSLVFHPSGEFVLSADLRGAVKQWKVSDGAAVRSFDAKALHSYNGGQQVDFGGVRTLAISTDGKYLACGGLHKAENPLGAVHEPLVLLFEWESQKLIQSHAAEGVKGVAWRVVFHPGGFLIGVSGGSSGGFLLFWKPDQPKEFHRFQLPNLAREMDLHPDGIQVAAACFDRQLRISRLSPKVG